MDPSVNAWATPAEQSQSLTDLQAMLARNHHANATPSAPANPYEVIIEKLTQEIQTLKSNSNGGTAPSKPRPAKVKKAPSTKSKASKAAGPSSTATPKKKQPVNTTPKRGKQAASAPPNFTHEKTPVKIKKPTKEVALIKPSPKQHPQQMQTHDFPPGFTPTKTALFFHIKILWGLVKQDLVPKPPKLNTLQEFYNQFPHNVILTK
ncbi:hypothetical protein VP01_1660g8 [Puccinia sorghi]|uniref:Uncharacterized protein n=1 Tax=Puccinia sorghi TaxID=27349 RepID=A0A0L6VG93_9BASI|nr:hypothetical protein VP01_1660g8 [Puccinia sorghi]